MSGYLIHVVYIYIPTLSVLETRLEVRAIFQPQFLPGVAQLASMARSTSAASDAMDVKEEDFSCDYDGEDQADDDMGSPEQC